MNKTVKHFLTFVAVAVACMICCITAFAASGEITELAVSPVSCESADDLGSVDWYKGADGNYYIFLPDTNKTDGVKVWFTANDDVYCSGEKLVNGEATSVFSSGGQFTVTCGDSSYAVVVLYGGDIASIYINTESGSLDHVHANKENREAGNILAVDRNGNVQYNGKLDYIKGRGNSTWTADTSKKPYNIKLDKKADLFGMGKSKKWCLLANYGDITLLRNQFAFDLAENIGVESALKLTQVNLYINGVYRGLYMITEKVEIGDNRIEIYDLEGASEDVNDMKLDTYPLAGAQDSIEWGSIKYAEIPNDPEVITGGYLLELEKIYRYVNEPSGFISRRGQAVVVKTPEYASKAQVEYISAYYQDFEDAFYSPTGYNSKGKHYSEYIDVESLAKMYIMEEFAENFDGCSSSFFLYKDTNGKLTAGPAWDFDLGFDCGMSNNLINHVSHVGDPDLLYIKTCFIGNHNERKYGFLAQAYMQNDFQQVVSKIWKEKFVSYFDTFKANMSVYEAELTPSVLMNAVRWNTFGTTDANAVNNTWRSCLNGIYSFVDARYSVLNTAFADDTYYVKYDIGEYGKTLINDNTFYKAGSKAFVAKAPVSTDKNVLFVCWTLNPDGSGKIYEEGDEIVVNDNTVLYAQWAKKNSVPSVISRFFESISRFILKAAVFMTNIFA